MKIWTFLNFCTWKKTTLFHNFTTVNLQNLLPANTGNLKIVNFGPIYYDASRRITKRTYSWNRRRTDTLNKGWNPDIQFTGSPRITEHQIKRPSLRIPENNAIHNEAEYLSRATVNFLIIYPRIAWVQSALMRNWDYLFGRLGLVRRRLKVVTSVTISFKKSFT